uniref:Doublecortin domain-containing protein n=1 Tax=Acrobeloides nanus TaxID=290746 RepID=A0A914CWD1_9BILA
MTHSSLMSISPSFYDPYNNISFVELNKNRRRDYDRTPNERIYNQVYKPRTLKIYIRRNGDRESKPKQFIWRVWQSSKLSDLIEEAGNHLNMNEPEQLFDSHGRLITDSEQIIEGAIYVVATQNESFDRRSVDIPAYAAQHHTTQMRHPRATAHQTKHTSPRRKPSMPYLSRTPSPSTHRHYREQDDIYSVNQLPYEPPPISTPGRTERPYSDYGQYNTYNSQYNGDHYHDDPRYNSNHYQASRHTYPETRSAKQHPTDIEVIDDWGIGDLDEIKRRDHEMLE